MTHIAVDAVIVVVVVVVVGGTHLAISFYGSSYIWISDHVNVLTGLFRMTTLYMCTRCNMIRSRLTSGRVDIGALVITSLYNNNNNSKNPLHFAFQLITNVFFDIIYRCK